MATVMKTPGVYIVEKDAFPNSVVEVATAVPAFIGYTEKGAPVKPQDPAELRPKAQLITSMAEFRDYFGGPPEALYTLSPDAPAAVPAATQDDPIPGPAVPAGPDDPVGSLVEDDGTETPQYLSRVSRRYHLYHSMLLFFKNGGGRCYVISVGAYEDDEITKTSLEAGIGALRKEQEPTMIVIPDAVLLAPAQCTSLQQAAILHCSDPKIRSRFAINDIYRGFVDRQPEPDPVAYFRNNIGVDGLDFAAAYYPWVETTLVEPSQLGFRNLDPTGRTVLAALVEAEGAFASDPTMMAPLALSDEELADEDQGVLRLLDKSLNVKSKVFKKIVKEMQANLNLLPPSGAMAGIYTKVDTSRGVWKAPANVSLNSVSKPAVSISHDDQEDLNVTEQGKSVNAIRSFIGEGTLVWGARTLDGNSLDWRYISVRRTMIMLEQSIKLAAKAYVFEANDANTWITVKSMIRNFLTGIWKRGGLAGATPDEAFSVHVGLGETMTSEDILEGILRVTVLVAVTRPAEFIEITFQQQMQKS